ncbi:hypothetical protein K2P47_05095 [Patescibacteria group bacterium]|nr:hypothetical protein [Patescibacteria group bacterium]
MTNLVGILCGDKIFKRVFLSALLLITISTFFFGSFAHVFAQEIPGIDRPFRPGDPGYVPPPTPGGGGAQPGAGGAQPGGGGGGGADAGQAAADAAQQEAALAAASLGSQPDGVLGLLYSFVISGIGWLVGVAGNAFDYAIDNYIIGFGEMYRDRTGETIDALWGTVRDIFNLTFIFGLVYIGFKMILDSSDSSARKMLVSLIAAALLVNFSLFITKFVVDFSNIAATQIYNAFEPVGVDGAAVELSITNGFMTMMGVNSMLGYEYVAGGSFTYVFGILIVFSILAYVFLAGAVMIIIRFVVLNIYMVFSPFMFLGWVFPALQGYSRDYWSGFLRQAFFAPAFIFMLYLSYVVAGNFPVQRNLDRIFNPNLTTVTDYADTIPYFAMVIVFLCASMIVAKKMGAHGSTAAISIGNKLRGGAQGMLYRNTGGRLAKGAMNVMDRTGMSNNYFGRSLRGGLKKGYEYGAGGTSLSQYRANVKSQKDDINKNRVRMNSEESSARRATNFDAQMAALQNNTLGTNELNAAMNGLAATIREMSDDERGDLSISQLTNHHVAANLTDAHISSLEKTGTFSVDEINSIRASRRQAQINVAQHGFATVSTVGGVTGASNTAVRGASAAHQVAQRQRLLAGGDAVVGNMPVDALIAPAMLPYITPRIIEARMKSGITEADRVRLRNAIQSGVTTPAMMVPWAQWQGQSHYGAEFFR